VNALSQFVAWPGYLAFRDKDRLVYDGGRLGLPTLHGVVVRKGFAGSNRPVLDAFLRAQIEATDFLHQHPLQAAETVAEQSGLPPEVVYLYNGRGGVATFDPTIKTPQVDALGQDVPFLETIGVLSDKLDLDRFVNDEYLKAIVGSSYDTDAAATTNPAAITGTDQACQKPVDDPATAGEIWVDGDADTAPVADATCLLRNAKALQTQGKTIRAAYIPDALTGTRWFADKSVWVQGADGFHPFATQDNATTWIAQHPGATLASYDDAVKAA
jgi:NitT/TauT family transport system substrate-binding protein